MTKDEGDEMIRSLRCLLEGAAAAAILVAAGCDARTETTVMPPGAPPSGAVGEGGQASNPEIKKIMLRVAKGPMSLTPLLGRELKEASPDWPLIQGQTTEYAQLADLMTKLEPPRGEKASWTDLAGDFLALATQLDGAAHAKDATSALAAQAKLSESCMTCHQMHRAQGRGRGGMGGPPPGGIPNGSLPKMPAPPAPPVGDRKAAAPVETSK